VTTPITPAQLRANFPEFSSPVNYPDGLISFWLTLGYKLLPAERWFDVLDEGVQLYTAHNIVLEFQAMSTAAAGGPPGISTGPISNKSVDKVSVGYSTGDSAEKDAGNWNDTTYGKRFIRLARMMGAGPVQVGIGSGPSTYGSTGAWAGPWPWNFPNQNQ